MPVLTLISLILTAIKIVGEVSDWLAKHPEVTAAGRATLARVQAQAQQIEVDVEDLRETHARVEAP